MDASPSGNSALYEQMLVDDRDAVKNGANILVNHKETYPEERPWQDVPWAALFLIVYALLLITALANSDELSLGGTSREVSLNVILLMSLVSALVSFVLAYAFYSVIRMNATLVIYMSLLVFPCITVFVSIAIMVLVPSAMLPCMGLIFIAGLSIFCTFFCYQDLIPFTAQILTLVAGFTQQHPCTMAFSLGGAIASNLWTALAVIAVAGAFGQVEECSRPRSGDAEFDRCHHAVTYPIYFAVTFIFIWGNQVCVNTAHTMNCGVFGQWYYGKVVEPTRAAANAMTKNFGSVCFGSFIVAILRAAQHTLRFIRGQADNIVVMIVIAIVECIVACIAGMAEAFNSYSYVTVAVRGLSFYESSVATWALCTWSNVLLIIAGNLVNMVVQYGAFLCGSIGAAVGIAAGLAAGAGGDGEFRAEMFIGFVAAFAAGMVVAYNTLQVIDSGFKTVVVCWAEDRAHLGRLNPDLHQVLADKAEQVERELREVEMEEKRQAEEAGGQAPQARGEAV